MLEFFASVLEFIASKFYRAGVYRTGAALEFIVLEFFASVLEFIALMFYCSGVYRTRSSTGVYRAAASPESPGFEDRSRANFLAGRRPVASVRAEKVCAEVADVKA